MKHNKINSRKGFTLVEMLGVLAIIAILISVISVGVLSAINRARTVATVSNFKNLETALLSYIALPEAAGRLPLTKSPNAIPLVANLAQNATDVASGLTTGALQNTAHMETIFLAAGTLERLPNWRMGLDAVQSGMDMSAERGWNRKRSAWSNVAAVSGGTLGSNDWSKYVRTECAPTATKAEVANPGKDIGAGLMHANGVQFKIDGSSYLPLGTRTAYVVLPGLSLKDAEKLSEELNGSLNDMDTKEGLNAQARGRFVTDGVAADGVVTAFYYLANM
ncbi:prepilin-type N-terminal cleavage/methylation domain-containing protein [Ereboglobus sp. PH5-10]|uniref:type II secretion system protein n=1 Tax=Ereboglobus sp. PH5-10 TaxID=2940629 RepID=UPI0024058D26|nr:type II secretion system protein [Ereboglobus sp. PH5-10]MDF9828345.1 prepilin-type N-terminal cleavage/methylation domain-containing protein [Ereboglobus sp. PH5-10]